MKKIFGLITVFSILALPILAAGPVNSNNSGNQSLPAAHITVHKKVPLSEITEEPQGPPTTPPGHGGTPPGQDKDEEEGTASGSLGPKATGTKYAIVIGICDYPGTDYDLCESDGDSLHMYKALTTLYEYDPANIYLFKDMGEEAEYGGTYFEEDTTDDIPAITAQKPTRENILGAINTIKATVTSDDEVVFFFSGHGANSDQDVDNDGEIIDEAIVVHDDGIKDENEVEDDNSQLDFIWDGELRAAFGSFATTRIAFIFDTCRAGGMNDVTAAGRVVSMATGENQSAYVYSTAGEDVDGDGIKDGEGVFSRYFVNKGMLQGLADKYDHDSDGIFEEGNDVVVEEAFDYAKENIPPRLKRRQKPAISDQFTAGNNTKDLLL